MGNAVGLDGNGRPYAIPHDDQASDPTGSGDVNIALLEATMVRPQAPTQVVAAKTGRRDGKSPSARDMVRDIKARLRVVNAEIRARKNLERERDQLQRLLAAVKTKPAPVRAIRSAG